MLERPPMFHTLSGRNTKYTSLYICYFATAGTRLRLVARHLNGFAAR